MRGQRRGPIVNRRREGAIEGARHFKVNHPPTTPALDSVLRGDLTQLEREAIRKAEAKRQRRATHRGGAVTVLEATE